MGLELNEENKAWISDYIKKNKRKPRVLHISNIANNAYINAKIFNACGLENHVINACYFAMGCPEWEDAYFTDKIDNLWKPDWCEYNLNGD